MTAVGADRRDGGPRRRLRVVFILGVGVLGLLAGLVVAATRPTRYDSTVRLLVGPIGGARETLDAAALLSTTYADLLSSRAVVSRVSESLGIDLQPEDVSARADERSRVILLTVSSGDEDVPVAAANALADRLVTIVADSPAGGVAASNDTAVQVQVLDEASKVEPVSSPDVLFVLGGGIIGLLAGWGLTRLIPDSVARLDEEYLVRLGIPSIPVPREAGSVALSDDLWDLTAARLDHHTDWGQVATSVAFVPIDDHEDSTVVLYATSAYARHGLGVALCDADIHYPCLAQHLEGSLERWTGGEALACRRATPVRQADGSLLAPSLGAMRVITTAAEESTNSVARLHHILAELPPGDRLAVLCPPIGASPVATSVGLVVDRVVLVVHTGRTHAIALERALASFRTIGVDVAAILEVEGDLALPSVTLRLHEPVAAWPEFRQSSDGPATQVSDTGGDSPVGRTGPQRRWP